ncbi:ferritin-like domain-containing protein, partial [Acinetobacter pittii]
FKAASEERQHAIKLIEYLLMRGELTQDFDKLIQLSEIKVAVNQNTLTPIDALKEALKLETKVTNSIKRMMDACEEPKTPEDKDKNDYHFVDYLTTEFLDEQYKGQRDLAGKVSTLGKMIKKMSGQNG